MNIQYAMIFVSDMAAATLFFKTVVGLPLKFESPHWTEFATDGATLALHLASAPEEKRQPGKDPAGTVRIGFNVVDLAGFHQRMLEHSVACIQEPTLQFGTHLAQYLGPDGLVFSVGERSEQTSE